MKWPQLRFTRSGRLTGQSLCSSPLSHRFLPWNGLHVWLHSDLLTWSQNCCLNWSHQQSLPLSQQVLCHLLWCQSQIWILSNILPRQISVRFFKRIVEWKIYFGVELIHIHVSTAADSFFGNWYFSKVHLGTMDILSFFVLCVKKCGFFYVQVKRNIFWKYITCKMEEFGLSMIVNLKAKG